MELKVFKIIHPSIAGRHIYYVLAGNKEEAIRLCQQINKNVDELDTITEINSPSVITYEEDY